MLKINDPIYPHDISYELMVISAHLRLLSDVATGSCDEHIKMEAFAFVMGDLHERLETIHTLIT